MKTVLSPTSRWEVLTSPRECSEPSDAALGEYSSLWSLVPEKWTQKNRCRQLPKHPLKSLYLHGKHLFWFCCYCRVGIYETQYVSQALFEANQEGWRRITEGVTASWVDKQGGRGPRGFPGLALTGRERGGCRWGPRHREGTARWPREALGSGH